MVGCTNESARDAWIRRMLQQLPAGASLLDAGAGEQPYRRYCSHLHYVAQDLAEYDGTGNATALQTGTWSRQGLDIISDITGIPAPDASFDAILCTEVLEHLPDPLMALKEFSRLLKPGGHLLLTAPFCSLTHFAPYHFATGFSRFYYETHLPAHGFRIVELEANGNFFEYIAQELRRLPWAAEKYAGTARWSASTLFMRVCIKPLLWILQRFSKRQRNSEELLCYGYHVHAVRQ